MTMCEKAAETGQFPHKFLTKGLCMIVITAETFFCSGADHDFLYWVPRPHLCISSHVQSGEQCLCCRYTS